VSASFREERLDVNGVETAVLTAGAGEPLVYLHGAGTAFGFDHLLPLAERAQLVVPFHPGFGRSADDPAIDSLHDYVLHYLDLLDRLGIDRLSLAGESMGGCIAAWLAIEQAPRVRRLVLQSPFGLKVPGHPSTDFFSIPDEEVPGFIVADPALFAAGPGPPSPEFLAERYREATSFARVAWKSPYDRKLPAWLHRITAPTLLLWGAADRLHPVGQAAAWAELIPGAEVRIFPGVGHAPTFETPEAVAALARFVAAETEVIPS
jgi:pimeloyl-ACP methyl ester carboxylesterase